MLRNLLESVTSMLKAIIVGSLLLAATAGTVTIAYFIIMSCYRLIGSTWSHLFSRPWP